jgi:acetyltransferase
MARFHATLSERSIEHERLTRICFVDYDREMALVAERLDPQAGEAGDPWRRPAYKS